MSHINENVKREFQGSHRYSYTPSVEEQFNALPPSWDLVDFYRKKLSFYEKEFTRMTEKVNMCKRSCDIDVEIAAELRRCNDEVFTLQKALSDVQVYLHQERNQVILLNSENEMLKIQLAKDRKTIDFLLPLSGATEDQVNHLINDEKDECLRKSEVTTKKREFKFIVTENKCNGGEKDPEILSRRINTLETQLRELTKASQDEVHSLHQDRNILKIEKEKDYQRLQNEISLLTQRLSMANVRICELTSELITLKKDFIQKEEKWILEKEKGIKHKHPCGAADKTPEKCENQSKIKKESIMKTFKDQLQQKEKLIRLYKEQCVSLENELWELNNSKEKSAVILQAQVEKVNQQLANMKDKYQKLYQKRWFEAEGLRSEVMILKGRIKGLERKLAYYSNIATEREELSAFARETRNAAFRLEKEVCKIRDMMGLDSDD